MENVKISWCAILATTLGVSVDSLAEPAPDLSVLIEAHASRPRAWHSNTAFKLTFKRFQFATRKPEEIARLREEARGKPDHPGHLMIATHERRALKPDVSEYVVFWRPPNEWRLSCTMPDVGRLDASGGPVATPADASPYFFDAARRVDVSWRLLPGQLDVAKGNAQFPPEYSPQAYWSPVQEVLRFQVAGGFEDPTSATQRPTPVFSFAGVAARAWSADVKFGELALRLTGRATAELGLVTDVSEVVSSKVPRWIGSRRVLSDWQAVSAGDQVMPVAMKMQQFSADGTLVDGYQIDSLIPIGDSEFEAATAVPDPAARDPVRGQLMIRVINDFGDPSVQSRMAMSSRGPSSPPDAHEQYWRWAGWSGLVGCVVVLIGLRMRKANS